MKSNEDSSGLKPKKTNIQNPSPIIKANDQSLIDSPKQKTATQTVFPQLIKTMTSFAAVSLRIKNDSSRISCLSPPTLTSKFLSPPQELNTSKSQDKLQILNFLAKSDIKCEDSFETFLRMPKIKQENKPLSPIRNSNAQNFSPNFGLKNIETSKIIPSSPSLVTLTSGFNITSKGQPFRFSSIRERRLHQVLSPIEAGHQAKDQSLGKKSSIDKNAENNSMKYTLFNQPFYSPKTKRFVTETAQQVGPKYVKVRTEVVGRWGEHKREEFMQSKRVERSDTDNSKTPDKKEKERAKSQLRLTLCKRENSSIFGGSNIRQRRKIQQEGDLSLESDYSWIDRHNANIIKRNNYKAKLKERPQNNDTHYFGNLTIRASHESSFVSKRSQRPLQNLIPLKSLKIPEDTKEKEKNQKEDFLENEEYYSLGTSGLEIMVEENDEPEKS